MVKQRYTISHPNDYITTQQRNHYAASISESVLVYHHSCGGDENCKIPPYGPADDIFEIGLKPSRQIIAAMGRTTKAAYLRQPCNPGLERVAMPVTFVDLPEQLLPGQRPERVRTRADDAHRAKQDIEELR